MADQIQIKDLLLRAIIGINDEERRNRQDVLINITLDTDLSAAGQSDDIRDVVNYRSLTKRIIDLVENSQYYLVEKLAAEIVVLCLDDQRVEQASVTVEKPGALRFAHSVGVTVQRTRAQSQAERVFIALGSNINSEYNLRQAVRRLAEYCRVLAVSPVYETQPVGAPDQPNFLNAAVLIETTLSAAGLKTQVLQVIEHELGRQRTADKNAPRTIDLDIVLFGDHVLDLGQRHIPDPDLLKYVHLARPLADLAPEQRHPETDRTLLDIADQLPDDGLKPRPDLSLWPA